MRTIFLQGVPFEGSDAFATSLAKRSVVVEHCPVPKDGFPKDTGDLLIVMGRPMP